MTEVLSVNQALVFMSWRAAIGGEAILQTVGETASALVDRLAVTQKEGTA